MKKAIGYLRISDRAGTEFDLSMERQRRAIDAWCVANGYEVTRVEVDAGISGTRVRRPGLNAAMMYANLLGQPIIVASLDRLGRSYKVLDRIRRSKVEMIVCDLPNSSSLITDMLMAVAKSYSEAVSTKMKSYHADRKAKVLTGEKTSHPVPTTATWMSETENKKLMSEILVDARREKALKRAESQRDLKKHLQQMHSTGQSMRAIAKELNDQGMKSPRAGKWTATAVHRLLHSSF